MLESGRYERELRPLLHLAAGYAHSLLRNRQDAEDAVQQSALQGWQRFSQCDATRPFKGWWFAILRNCCVDILRGRNAPDSHSLTGVDAPADEIPERFEWQSLELALRKLSDAHVEVLRLKDYGDLNYDEIAETLNIPKGTVMSRLHPARKALARQLDEVGQ